MTEAKRKILPLLMARYPLLMVRSHEEQRVEDQLVDALRGENVPQYAIWSMTDGLKIMTKRADGFRLESEEKKCDAEKVLAHALACETSRVYVLRDFHPFLKTPNVVRLMRDCSRDFIDKEQSRTIVMLGAVATLPPEIEREVTVVDYDLPDRDELAASFRMISAAADQPIDRERLESLVSACLGLSKREAENVAARSLYEKGMLDEKLVLAEKCDIVRRGGLLEFVQADAKMSSVGGLGNLKRWMKQRRKALTPAAAKYGLPTPKGVLLMGVQGAGKSVTAKATAVEWGLPLLRMDVGRLFNKMVGQSEENLRLALATAETVSPCVLWLN